MLTRLLPVLAPLFFVLPVSAQGLAVLQAVVPGAMPQDWPHISMSAGPPMPRSPPHCSHLSIPPLFLLTPRKATMALTLEFDLGWGAEWDTGLGQVGMRA